MPAKPSGVVCCPFAWPVPHDERGDKQTSVSATIDLHTHRRLADVSVRRRVSRRADLELDAADVVTPASEETPILIP